MAPDSSPLEQAWNTFQLVDLSPADWLALEFAEIDNDEFTRLQHVARGGGSAKKVRAAADALFRLVEGVGSATALDQVVGVAYDACEAWADALEARRRALTLTPPWQPLGAAKVVGNIAFDLMKLGRLPECVQWSERAMWWDPTNPYVLGNLAEALLHLGDAPRAFGLRAYLHAYGYGAPIVTDFDALAASRRIAPPRDVAPHAPRADAMAGFRGPGLERFVASTQFDRNLGDKERLRGFAVACAMKRRLDYALFAARLAVRQNGDAVDAAWCRAVHDAIARAGDGSQAAAVDRGQASVFSPDDATRENAVLQLAKAQDREALFGALHDPSPGTRTGAAHGLVALGDARAVPLLEALATVEEKKNLDNRRVADVGWSATWLLRVFGDRQRFGKVALLVVPEEGPDHPVFEAPLGAGDVLSVVLTFVELDEALAHRANDVLAAAGQAIERAMDASRLSVHVEMAEESIHVVLGGLPRPRDAARILVDAFRASPLPLREVLLARFALPTNGESSWRAIPDPRLPAEQDYDDDDARWAASFDRVGGSAPPAPDPRRPPPLGEPEGGLFMMFPAGQGYAEERRTMQPFFPGFRIVYGLPDVDDRPADARDAAVTDALARAFDATFRGRRPRLFNKKNEKDRLVDPIACRGRRGYAFAIQGLSSPMVVHYPRATRIREYELFAGVRDAARALGLAPVVHWYREGGVWVLNVWEA